jgi:Lrp/AsnC family transcriptional regulator, leucine-responsive regulatory protein
MEIDPLNRGILAELQRDCRIAVAELAARVGLSPSACHRRVKQLEEAGLISGYVARLDRRALGFAMEFFIEVSLRSQSDKALDAFERAVQTAPEILECHLMAGGTDYLLRVVATDTADFERIHHERLARLPNVARLQSHLAIRTVRGWNGYPVAPGYRPRN